MVDGLQNSATVQLVLQLPELGVIQHLNPGKQAPPSSFFIQLPNVRELNSSIKLLMYR